MTGVQPKQLAHWGWAMLIWGAPWSHAAMSFGTAWVGLCAALALWQRGGRSSSPKVTLHSPLFWLTGLFAWHSLSLLWSESIESGVHLLSIQLPLLVLAWASHFVPVSDQERLKTWVFRSAALAMAGLLIWGCIKSMNGATIVGREWTPWMSHIRLSLMIALGLVWGHKQPRFHLFIYAVLWITFTAVTGSFTSALMLPISMLYLLMIGTNPKQRKIVTSATVLGVLLSGILAVWWLRPVPMPMPVDRLPAQTKLGNAYRHNHESILSEGGHRLHLFWCEKEWGSAWRQVSSISLDTPDKDGFTIRDRLPRYLTSLGWPKDAEHILRLTPIDVAAIEGGATHHLPRSGILLRMRQFKREWEVWIEGGDPSGNAAFQRLEHWSAGWAAWMAAPLWGHGSGDKSAAMDLGYKAEQSRLKSGHRHGAHMQHLTWGISGGLVAFLLWMAFGVSWWTAYGQTSRIRLWGGVVIGLSCLFEDTLETQAGIVLCSLALFAMNRVQPSDSAEV